MDKKIENTGIYIVIPTYNRKKYITRCLNMLKDQTYSDFKIIVIDDGSSDGTADNINKYFPEVILIKVTGNYWWTKSVNEGIKYAMENEAEYILLLNDDVAVSETYIESFVNVAKEKPDMIMGSSGYDINTNKLFFCGEKKDWRSAKVTRGNKIEAGHSEDLIESDVLHGRGLWIPSKVFKEIGLMDSVNFPQNAADTDFTLRAKNAGIDLYCNMKAKVYFNTTDIGNRRFKMKKNIINIWKYLTSIYSSGNLKIRLRLALKNCPRKYLLQYIILDTIRTVGSYLFK
ncbi:glycosyltransferase family 2 protein [Elusimicrobiota bacterium]